MSGRFISNTALLLAGGFMVVASQAFAASAVGWITFGVALGILAMLALCQIDGTRGMLQRSLDATGGILGIWTVVASIVFTGATLTWLSLGEGIGFMGLALAGLIMHELKTERVVHSLAVDQGSQPREQYQRAA
jgi:hypothetical protein